MPPKTALVRPYKQINCCLEMHKMAQVFRAEWEKIFGNRFMAVFLIWIYPVGTVVMLGLTALVVLLSADGRAAVQLQPPTWIEQMLLPWTIVNSQIGRLFVVALAAQVFAAEYHHSMWKNLLPRRSRLHLFFNKFLVLGVIVLLAFISMSVIAGVGSGLVVWLAGGSYGPALTPDLLGEALPLLGNEALVAFLAALLGTCYAALACVITHSVVMATLAALLLVALEQTIPVILLWIGTLTNTPDFGRLWLWFPGYQLSNLASWGRDGTGYLPPFLQTLGVEAPTAGASLLGLLLWLVLLIGLAAWYFRRQDVMN
jgi:ABC-type transport system involved in multi-copper enzyme maturation permease subunit